MLKIFKNRITYLCIYNFGFLVYFYILIFIILDLYAENWFIIITIISISLIIYLLGFLIIKKHFKQKHRSFG